METIKIKRIQPEEVTEMQALLYLFRDVFEQKDFVMPSTEHLQNMLTKPEHLVFIALLQGTVVGGLTAYILPEFETEFSLVYIYDLAVTTAHQRKGIGQQLIAGVNSYCRSKGIKEVFVQADEQDDYAVDFYRKTKGKEMKVVQFTYQL